MFLGKGVHKSFEYEFEKLVLHLKMMIKIFEAILEVTQIYALILHVFVWNCTVSVSGYGGQSE